MLTLFAIPKPFRGHIATVQRNAIRSWMMLEPQVEILLFGDDEGTAEAAAMFGVKHIPDVARNEYGTPLVNHLFKKAQHMAAHDLLCYANADILLMSDFMQAVAKVAGQKRRFLLVGQRWDLDGGGFLDFAQGWEVLLRNDVKRHSQLHAPTGIDYFVFPRGLWGDIPPFAIGRTVWDNWLLYGARSKGASLVDATQVITVVHQNHDYSHTAKGETWVWQGPEAKRNLELAGGLSYAFTLQDATHMLTPEGLRLAADLRRITRHLDTLAILHPRLRWPIRLLLQAIRLSYPVRVHLGLTFSNGGSRNA